jgi:hypothetical protein
LPTRTESAITSGSLIPAINICFMRGWQVETMAARYLAANKR